MLTPKPTSKWDRAGHMKRIVLATSLLALLAACQNTNPFIDDFADGEAGADPGDVETLPGTENPSSGSDIFRKEEEGDGGGLVTTEDDGFVYDDVADTYTIDGIAFDGDNEYESAAILPGLGGYDLYEADNTAPDSLTGADVDQITPYRALVGLSTNDVDGDPRTRFAIVRTGGYVGYGFGGFLYERNGGVTLPSSGFAQFSGDYAGIRVFQERGGIEYVEGSAVISIDFDDFNTNAGVAGSIYDRVIYDSSGAVVAYDPDTTDDTVTGPYDADLNFIIQQNEANFDENGEFQGELRSNVLNADGSLEVYEDGVYYAVMAGDATDAGDGGEIVGVIVVTSTDPRFESGAQETGGFIVYRDTP